MKLYEINKELENCFILEEGAVVNKETGEILDSSYLDSLLLEREEKIDGIACFIKNLKAEEEAIANEIKILQQRKKVKENKIESLKNYLGNVLDGEKYESARARISYRSASSVLIEDEVIIPAKYITYEPKVDKIGISAALKLGDTIPGAKLVTNTSIQIK